MAPFDDSALKEIITGRVEPHIYSFETNTLPNLLKIGDTYRPVEERLDEWRRHYKDLSEVSRHKALVEENIFFRDHSVHRHLLSRGKIRAAIDRDNNIHSNEFFEDTNSDDVTEAVADVIDSFSTPGKYTYYDGLRNITESRHERTKDFKPRGNQQAVIENFTSALAKGRTNLLMYAVMRFGKSITSMWCAKEMDSKLTIVVSAKADVKDEWKQTVESHKDFIGYQFMDGSKLAPNTKFADIYGQEFKTGSGETEICTNIVIFFTLQDLAGSTNEIKQRHLILEDANPDLLIIDETHFGARAQVLGKILAGVELTEEDQEALKQTDSVDDLGRVGKLESISAKVNLHLSGTPYRILMGSEFEQEDIIAFVQFSDIYEAKTDWQQKNLDQEEWHNPYYGFPQMIRFAFNPNERSRKKLESIPGAKPSEIFAPVDTTKDGNYQTFRHEAEAIELLQALDGSKHDTQLLGLLDHESIKAGKLARHIVIVLPNKASCDAFEKLVTERSELFENISEYEILNIAGLNARFKTVKSVKEAIERADSEDKKTITLTVNKMLTGTTVPQWDTMLYLKATISPQEYDQAIFRLQSPWVKTYTSETGDVIKYDMKPQTLLVDLDPTRLFYLQEAKALSYGVNTNATGNENIECFIEREIKVSPILVVNTEGSKLIEINASNIMDAVRKYSSERSINEDVRDISIDLDLIHNQQIFDAVKGLSELGSKNGLNISPSSDDGQDILTETDDGTETNDLVQNDDRINHNKDANDSAKAFERKLRMYYVLILLFAFLSSTEEKTLADVIKNLDANEDNRRISKSLGLNRGHLITLKRSLSWSTVNTLDYKIQNASFRAIDVSISPIERVNGAVSKFGRLSASEVFTPVNFVDQIYASIGNIFQKDRVSSPRYLDIASKSGSFAAGFVKKSISEGVGIEQIKDSFYSIPTSRIAYEFTRKSYEALGLNIANIAKHITSYDIIELDDPRALLRALQKKSLCEITKQDLYSADVKIENNEGTDINMKFSAIVGNPPYNISDNSSGTGSAKPLYNLFIESSISLKPDYISLITPSVWFTGGKGLDTFRSNMLQDVHFRNFTIYSTPKDVFPKEDLRGGINYFLWDASYDNSVSGVHVAQYEKGVLVDKRTRPFVIDGAEDIFISDSRAISVVQNLFNTGVISKSLSAENMLARHVSSRNPFGISTTFWRTTDFHESSAGLTSAAKLYVKNGISGFISQDSIKRNKSWLSSWKVITPFANNISTDRPDDNLNTLISEPGSVASETYLTIGAELGLNEQSAENLSKYLRTKWTRALIGLAKANQNGTRGTYRFVPLQDFTSNSDIDWSRTLQEIDEQLYLKYGLSAKEKSFINARVKAME